MSNDLISRKALMSYIERQYRQWGEEYNAEQILGDIEDFKTAYDTDKVVEQLKEVSEHARPVGWTTKQEIILTKRAIEIVKGGGME